MGQIAISNGSNAVVEPLGRLPPGTQEQEHRETGTQAKPPEQKHSPFPPFSVVDVST